MCSSAVTTAPVRRAESTTSSQSRGFEAAHIDDPGLNAFLGQQGGGVQTGLDHDADPHQGHVPPSRKRLPRPNSKT